MSIELRARIAQLESHNAGISVECRSMRSSMQVLDSENQRLIENRDLLTAENRRLQSANDMLDDQLGKLAAENQRLRADAERLDWLCANAPVHSECDTLNSFDWHCHLTLRDAIDAAKKEG